jgi:hypothetical protein
MKSLFHRQGRLGTQAILMENRVFESQKPISRALIWSFLSAIGVVAVQLLQLCIQTILDRGALPQGINLSSFPGK